MRDIRIRGARPQCLRIDRFDRRSDSRVWPAPCRSCVRQVRAVQLAAEQPHVARLVDAPPHGGHDRRRLEQVGLHAPRHASVCARSGDSRTVMRPSGLSSRTTLPVSVIQDVVRGPGIPSRRGRQGSDARRSLRTTSRFPIATVTGALRSVAGSKIVHCCREPAVRPPFASSRGKIQREDRDVSARSRFPSACCRRT